MGINATLIGQFITFAILVWFTMKYVWPPITQAMHDREKKIAAGLEAAERSKRELEMAERKAMSIIRDAKQQATHIIDEASRHSVLLVEEAKQQAKEEGARMIELAQHEISREVTQAKEVLKTQLATLVVAGAEKVIQRHLDASAHMALLDELVAEI
ncbi:MAG: F0F1 ATP synthase subunit B [Gammaproteobacteria bacterium RIFCSPHIGHO2_12_FULL_41_20]|nr:MAG: F0F1 ATP synthase subunit B [Gammaproteobacteria bacterium RIFCSPHIGHO2_12_FULL_41_20]